MWKANYLFLQECLFETFLLYPEVSHMYGFGDNVRGKFIITVHDQLRAGITRADACMRPSFCPFIVPRETRLIYNCWNGKYEFY